MLYFYTAHMPLMGSDDNIVIHRPVINASSKSYVIERQLDLESGH